MNSNPYQTVNTNGGINGGSGASQSSTDVFNGVHQSPSIEIRDDYIGSPASPLNDIYSTAPMSGIQFYCVVFIIYIPFIIHILCDKSYIK